MQRTLLTRCLLRSRPTRARRGHGGTVQTQRELERLALLEQTTLQPVGVRARQTPAAPQAATAAYLRDLPARVVQVRAEATSSHEGENDDGGASVRHVRVVAVEEPQVSNLTQFLARCKELKIQYSSDKDAAARRRGREALCTFWSHHASSAVACCHQGVREVGFVANYGLADTGMHLDLPGLWAMLRVVKTERAVASSVDATRILQYLARELQYLEGGVSQASHKRRDVSVAADRPSGAELRTFRLALTDLALDLLAFYFVVHSPSVNKSSPLTQEGSSTADAKHEAALTPNGPPSSSTSAIATAVDALSGLEVLAVVSAVDAAPEAIATVWERRHLWSLRRQREPAEVAAATPDYAAFPATAASAASSRALAEEVQHLLVAELFRFAAVQRRDLRLTDVVHGFALLRVHLRTLWPPYTRNNGKAPAQTGKTEARGTSGGATAPLPSRSRRGQLWYEKDTLYRVTWGLAVALVNKDRQLVSSYHYVKIVTTLAKLPAFVLSPSPDPKKELRRLSVPNAKGSAGHPETMLAGGEGGLDGVNPRLEELRFVLAETPPEQRPQTLGGGSRLVEDAATVALRPADFWRFIVSKACVFVPNLPPEQRRVVCRSLHLAVTEKRGQLLREGGGGPAPIRRPTSLERRVARSGFGRPPPQAADTQSGAASSDSLENILFPLVDEMAIYTENYKACIADGRRNAQQKYQRRQ